MTVVLISKRSLKPGDELLMDYRMNENDAPSWYHSVTGEENIDPVANAKNDGS
jgi:hypothetical protein